MASSYLNNKNLCVVSHDAGGAELLSSWLSENADSFASIYFVLDGPAKKIFSRKFPNCKRLSLNKSQFYCNALLCSTSWASLLEKQALSLYTSLCLPTVSFLDHWVNYAERFTYDNTLVLPDQLWVADEYALSLASKLFPQTKSYNVGNPYLKHMVSLIRSITFEEVSNSAHLNILYLAENITSHASKLDNKLDKWGYDEFVALHFLLQNLPRFLKLYSFETYTLTIRPHPSDLPGKYNKFLQEFPAIRLSNSSLEVDIAQSDCVAGCQTMAMVVALEAGKKVLCVIPPDGNPCNLPHDDIINLATLFA